MSPDQELLIVQRAARSVPASGEVWARYMRIIVSCLLDLNLMSYEQMVNTQERVDDIPEGQKQDEKESVHDVYIRALESKVVQQDLEQLIPLVLARASYERRRIEAGKADEDGLVNLIGILESGIEMTLQSACLLFVLFHSPDLGLSSFQAW